MRAAAGCYRVPCASMAGFNMNTAWTGLKNLTEWHGSVTTRTFYAAGVTDWGDNPSPKCKKCAADAFPVFESLWQAA